MTNYLYEKDLLVGRARGTRYERENPTDTYVTVPPAFAIHDSDGAVWTFGSEYTQHNGEFEFNVLRNDVDIGIEAKRIEYRKGRVWIFGHYGWKHFSRSRKHFI